MLNGYVSLVILIFTAWLYRVASGGQYKRGYKLTGK